MKPLGEAGMIDMTRRIVRLTAAAAVAVGLAGAWSQPASAAFKKGLWGYNGLEASADRTSAAGDDRSDGPGASRRPSSAGGSVFRTSFTLDEFEGLTGARMTNTVGGRTFYSFFRGRPTLREDGFNFYINRNNGRIVFRSLNGAQAPFQFTSVFTESGSRTTTNVNFDWANPQALAIGGFGQPIAVSLN
jgi:hypothetical protein